MEQPYLDAMMQYDAAFKEQRFEDGLRFVNQLLSMGARPQDYVKRMKCNLHLARFDEVIDDSKTAMQVCKNLSETTRTRSLVWLYRGLAFLEKYKKIRKKDKELKQQLGREGVNSLTKAFELDSSTEQKEDFKPYANLFKQLSESLGSVAAAETSTIQMTQSTQTHFNNGPMIVRSENAHVMMTTQTGNGVQLENRHSDAKNYASDEDEEIKLKNQEKRVVWYLGDILSVLVSLKVDSRNNKPELKGFDMQRLLRISLHRGDQNEALVYLATQLISPSVFKDELFVMKDNWKQEMRMTKDVTMLHFQVRFLESNIKEDAFETDLVDFAANIKQVIYVLLDLGDTSLSLPHGTVSRFCTRLVGDCLYSFIPREVMWVLDTHILFRKRIENEKELQQLLKPMDDVLKRHFRIQDVYDCEMYTFEKNCANPPRHLHRSNVGQNEVTALSMELKTQLKRKRDEIIKNQGYGDPFHYRPPIVDLETGFQPLNLLYGAMDRRNEGSGQTASSNGSPVSPPSTKGHLFMASNEMMHMCNNYRFQTLDESQEAVTEAQALTKVWDNGSSDENLVRISLEDIDKELKRSFSHLNSSSLILEGKVKVGVKHLEHYRLGLSGAIDQIACLQEAKELFDQETGLDVFRESLKDFQDCINKWRAIETQFKQIVQAAKLDDNPDLKAISLEPTHEEMFLQKAHGMDSIIYLLNLMTTAHASSEDISFVIAQEDVDNEFCLPSCVPNENLNGSWMLPLSLVRTDGIFVTGRCADLCWGDAHAIRVPFGHGKLICECHSKCCKIFQPGSRIPQVRASGKGHHIVLGEAPPITLDNHPKLSSPIFKFTRPSEPSKTVKGDSVSTSNNNNNSKKKKGGSKKKKKQQQHVSTVEVDERVGKPEKEKSKTEKPGALNLGSRTCPPCAAPNPIFYPYNHPKSISGSTFIDGLLMLEAGFKPLLKAVETMLPKSTTDPDGLLKRYHQLLGDQLSLARDRYENHCVQKVLSGAQVVYEKIRDKIDLVKHSMKLDMESEENNGALRDLVNGVGDLVQFSESCPLIETFLENLTKDFKAHVSTCRKRIFNIERLETVLASKGEGGSSSTSSPATNDNTQLLRMIMQNAQQASSSCKQTEKFEQDLAREKRELSQGSSSFLASYLQPVKRMGEELLLAILINKTEEEAALQHTSEEDDESGDSTVKYSTILEGLPKHEAQTILWKREHIMTKVGEEEALSMEEERRIKVATKQLKQLNMDDTALRRFLVACKDVIIAASKIVATQQKEILSPEERQMYVHCHENLHQIFLASSKVVSISHPDMTMEDLPTILNRSAVLESGLVNDMGKAVVSLEGTRYALRRAYHLKFQLLYATMAHLVLSRLRDRVKEEQAQQQRMLDLLKEEEELATKKKKGNKKKSKKPVEEMPAPSPVEEEEGEEEPPMTEPSKNKKTNNGNHETNIAKPELQPKPKPAQVKDTEFAAKIAELPPPDEDEAWTTVTSKKSRAAENKVTTSTEPSGKIVADQGGKPKPSANEKAEKPVVEKASFKKTTRADEKLVGVKPPKTKQKEPSKAKQDKATTKNSESMDNNADVKEGNESQSQQPKNKQRKKEKKKKKNSSPNNQKPEELERGPEREAFLKGRENSKPQNKVKRDPPIQQQEQQKQQNAPPLEHVELHQPEKHHHHQQQQQQAKEEQEQEEAEEHEQQQGPEPEQKQQVEEHEQEQEQDDEGYEYEDDGYNEQYHHPGMMGHQPPMMQNICRHFLAGSCKLGSNCGLRHVSGLEIHDEWAQWMNQQNQGAAAATAAQMPMPMPMPPTMYPPGGYMYGPPMGMPTPYWPVHHPSMYPMGPMPPVVGPPHPVMMPHPMGYPGAPGPPHVVPQHHMAHLQQPPQHYEEHEQDDSALDESESS